MTIEWAVKQGEMDLVSKRADVTFIRTDTEVPEIKQSFPFSHAIVEGPTAKDTGLLWDKLFTSVKFLIMKQEEKESLQVVVNEKEETLEQAGKAALEAWEAGR